MPHAAFSPQFLRRDFLVGAAAGVALSEAPRCLRGTKEIPLRQEINGVNPSYAQAGEDLIVLMILEHLRVEKPSYLDVGAFLPIYGSNTYLFYRRGGRGVLIEPNVALVPELRARRPGDVVLNVGVGLDKTEAADYYCMSMPQWNTFDKEEAVSRVRRSAGEVEIERVVKMPLVPINQILHDHFPERGPDFLSIDVESLDLAILRTLDFERFRPKIVCTETLVPISLTMESETTDFMKSRGYELRGVTFANSIYIDRTLLG